MRPMFVSWLWTLLVLSCLDNLNGTLVPRPLTLDPPPTPKELDISDEAIEEAFADAKRQIDEKLELEEKLPENNGVTPSRDDSYAELEKRKTVDQYIVDMNQNTQQFMLTAKYLKEEKKLTAQQAADSISGVQIPQDSQYAGEALRTCKKLYKTPKCSGHSEYRTADGSCNNEEHPEWGKSDTCFTRLLNPVYADGLQAPRESSHGGPLPNARKVSTTVFSDMDLPSLNFSLLTMQWGQFVDHDLTLTPLTKTVRYKYLLECCTAPSNLHHSACLQISIPEDDSFFKDLNQTCINFVRSSACGSGCKFGPLRFVNHLTPYLDGSNVYGSNQNITDSLRLKGTARLKTTVSSDGQDLLPDSEDSYDQCSRQETTKDCFLAGDERVNEQPGLTSMHTIWMRQHNRLVDKFQKLDPDTDPEELFQKVRKIVGAQIQMITYGEFLPIILSLRYMRHFGLEVNRGTETTEYDDKCQVAIMQEFASAAFRFGHTLIQNKFPKKDEYGKNLDPVVLREHFFFPTFLKEKKEISSLMRGMTYGPEQEFDRHVVEAVTNHLYKKHGSAFGMDLMAFNIQRAREHGIPGYIQYVHKCFGKKIKDWADLNYTVPYKNIEILKNAYNYVEDIDLFPGGLSETPLHGGVVGPTFACIIGQQFKIIKDGDRFFFEHKDSFKADQLKEIKKTKLSQILCINGHIAKIKESAFKLGGKTVDCSTLPDIDVSRFL